MSTPIVHVDDVRLTFGNIIALNDITFDVQPGELFAVIGPNGAGKSSLFNVLTRLYTPTAGKVELLGQDLTSLKTHQLASLGVARSYQNLGLLKSLSVVDNVLAGRHHLISGNFVTAGLGLPGSRKTERRHRDAAMAVLETFGLADIANRHVEELSYGTQKRVELARCVASEPKLLLLDEPVAGMSSDERVEVTRLIRQLHTDTDITIVLVEHDMGMVMSVADRVLVLDFGQVVVQGTPADVQADPRVIRAYLGEPLEVPA